MAKPKDGEFWVVSVNGDREVVKVSLRPEGGIHVYDCGSEEGWDATGRKDIKVEFIRKIRL